MMVAIAEAANTAPAVERGGPVVYSPSSDLAGSCGWTISSANRIAVSGASKPAATPPATPATGHGAAQDQPKDPGQRGAARAREVGRQHKPQEVKSLRSSQPGSRLLFHRRAMFTPISTAGPSGPTEQPVPSADMAETWRVKNSLVLTFSLVLTCTATQLSDWLRQAERKRPMDRAYATHACAWCTLRASERYSTQDPHTFSSSTARPPPKLAPLIRSMVVVMTAPTSGKRAISGLKPSNARPPTRSCMKAAGAPL